ncbi:hypothetical protein ACOME3_001355 [Neoechinorhynchus agilis]
MTSPIQPQFDGKSIRRLSWHCNKPFVQVLSQWENTEFRIQEVNRLTNLVEAVVCIYCARLVFEARVLKNVLKEESASNIGDLEAFMNMMKKQNELVKRRKNIQNDLDRTTQICRGRVLDHCIELCSKIHATKSHESRLELLQRIETMLKEICTEAQQSFPDIVVWMMSGTTRLSYARIPVEKVYFSQDSMTNGSCAGKTVTYKFHSISSNEVDAIMRMRLWFGSLDSHNTYTYDNASIELRAFVEVYENQVKCHDKWSTANYKRDGIFEWSDFYGKNQTLKDAFLLPASLKWLGDWYCEPVTTGAVSDGKLVHKSTIFEFQNRESKTGEWKATTDTGKQHDEVEMECFESVRQNKPPAGWTWLTDWYIDFQRAVDKDGWEYRSPEGTYSASSRLFHISRRRCWLRERAMKSIEKKDTESAHCIANDFWRYSAGVEGSVHEKEKNSDTVRRIRWRRRITVNEEDEVTNAKLNDKLPVIFKIEGHDEFSHKRMSSLTEMYYKNSNTYRLHAYIFQCKRLSIDHKLTDGIDVKFKILIMIVSGLSLSITYMGLSQSTAQLDKDSSMIWNEMLIFDKLVLYGSLSDIKSEPPYALVELIDNNNSTIISQKFLKPSTVDLEGSSKEKFKLSWISFKGVSITGEILMGLRLLQNEEYDLNIQRDFKTRFEIPEHIRPQTTHAHLMVFCWGLRESLKGIRVKDLTKPKLIIQVSGKIQELSSLEGLNFQVPAAHFDLNIPLDKQYAPEVIISLIDNKSFGRKSIVGVIRSQLEVCQIQDYSNGLFKAKDNLLAINSVPIPHESVTKFDWWSKFYASSGEIEKCGQYKTRRHATLEVLNGSLEDDMKNNKFEDMCQTYRFKDETKNDATVINMKARIFLCEASKYTDQVSNQLSLDSLPLNSYKCIVRVYIVRAFDLYTTDFDGNPDPYVRLSTSIQAIGDSSGRKSNSRSPLFGLLHEMTVTLPEERLLTVMVYDYNPLTRDDLIGQTCIDIENRIRTFYHAHCGLPEIYETSGPNRWRMQRKPMAILENLCALQNWKKPQISPKTELIVNKCTFKIDNKCDWKNDDKIQNIALQILRKLRLTREHVETRTLYNPAKPQIATGRLQMWIDKWLIQSVPTTIVEITPRRPALYQLRVVVWNVNTFLKIIQSYAREDYPDLYVEGQMNCGSSGAQKTDVHYRSVDGCGNFNYRLVFDFEYIETEERALVKKSLLNWNSSTIEENVVPELDLQLWDNDKFSANEFLGNTKFNINAISRPAKWSRSCSLKEHLKLETISIFDQQRIRGWWPLVRMDTGKLIQIGTIEAEFSIVGENEIKSRPVGKGREDPNINPVLHQPNRPMTSFSWFSTPIRTFRYVVLRHHKKQLILSFVITLVTGLLLSFLYQIPDKAWDLILSHLKSKFQLSK